MNLKYHFPFKEQRSLGQNVQKETETPCFSQTETSHIAGRPLEVKIKTETTQLGLYWLKMRQSEIC